MLARPRRTYRFGSRSGFLCRSLGRNTLGLRLGGSRGSSFSGCSCGGLSRLALLEVVQQPGDAHFATSVQCHPLVLEAVLEVTHGHDGGAEVKPAHPPPPCTCTCTRTHGHIRSSTTRDVARGSCYLRSKPPLCIDEDMYGRVTLVAVSYRQPQNDTSPVWRTPTKP